MTWITDNQTALYLELEGIKALLMEQIGDLQSGDGATSTSSRAELKQTRLSLEQSMAAPTAITRLCQLFRLSTFERGVLLLCAGMELDASFAPLFAAIHGDDRQSYPTLSLALGLLPQPDWQVLSAQSPLRRWQMIAIGQGRSLTSSPLRIDERILTWLMGIDQLDGQLRGWVRPVSLDLGDSSALVQSHQVLVRQMVNVWSHELAAKAENPLIQLCGRESSDRKALAAATCQQLGLKLHQLAAATLPHQFPDLHQLAQRWQREALLGNSALLVEWDNRSADIETMSQRLGQFVADVSTPVILSASERLGLGAIGGSDRKLITLDVPLPTSHEQLQLWESAVAFAPEQLNGQLRRLVGQFNLNRGMIQAAYLSTLGHLELSSEVSTPLYQPERVEDLLWQACRVQSRQRMDNLAQRIDSTATWEDLILPQAQTSVLGDIAVHLRHRLKVYQDWGLGGKSQRGLGITALFSGISGTGKTLAAEVLAQELKLDLYKIDLSTIVSKYIGETEKNLSRVFDAAETGGAILLFDEADALFGKRNEVKDSHDRYANIEVSYLLQRMESYRGLAILTTNLPDAIDRAFLRRIRFIVQFPFPDTAQREAIWKRMFPPQTPTENLSFKKLARLNVAGGNIRNIALTAAFLAAAQDKPIQMPHLLEATRREFHKLAMPLPEAETRGWA